MSEKLAAAVFICLGGLFILISVIYSVYLWGFASRGVEVTGIVLEEWGKYGGRQIGVVQFESDNRTFQFEFRRGKGAFRQYYQVGDEVKVLYDPDSPEKAILKDNVNFFLLFTFGLLGVISAFIGILALVQLKKATID